MVNDYINAPFVLNIVNFVGGDQVAHLGVVHPGSIFLFVNENVILNLKDRVINVLAKLKAYSGHRGLL